MNIYFGVMCEDLFYECCGVYVILDVLYGVWGEKVVDWVIMEKVVVELLYWIGVLFYYVDNGIDFGEVFYDVLKMEILFDDIIFELCWNNFNNSLFLVLYEGLVLFVEKF